MPNKIKGIIIPIKEDIKKIVKESHWERAAEELKYLPKDPWGSIKSIEEGGILGKYIPDIQKALKPISDFTNFITSDVSGSIRNAIIEAVTYIVTAPAVFTAQKAPLIQKALVHPNMALYTPTLLSAPEVISAHRRLCLVGKDNAYNLEWVKKTLGYSGHSFDNQHALHELTRPIPSAQDIISFAVREVYNRDIVSAFGQTEGFDKVIDEARDDLNAIGMKDEVFQKYWEAHWILPSIMQGFEMLHRKVIDSDTLDKLFTALDIMPYWRPQLQKISYRPFTRVDVRRMHKVGTLSDEEVITSYEDLGYSPEKAAKMADFTFRYNADPEDSDKTGEDKEAEEFKAMSRSDILRLYKIKILDNATARMLLQEIGYSLDTVEYLINREDFLLEEDRHKQYIKLYKEAYLTGLWNKNEIVGKLGSLALPSAYIQELLDVWDLELEVKIDMPSKSEIKSFLKKGIIRTDEAIEMLGKLGYNDKYIGWYIKDWSKKE